MAKWSQEHSILYVKGPDFPTAAFIYGRAGIKDYQETGRGRIIMRARAVIEEKESSSKAQIVVHDATRESNVDFRLPYDQVLAMWRHCIAEAYEPEALYRRFAWTAAHTYTTRIRPPLSRS